MAQLELAGIEEYLTIYVISMFKFVGGPLAGIAFGLSYLETSITTIMGMMTSVIIVSSFGSGFRNWLDKIFRRNRKLFTKRNRKFVLYWRKYGLFGVSFLTPIVFSPVVGTLLVSAFGGSKKKILTYMLISAVFWAFALTKVYFLIPDLFTR